jgi:hypothetical protein
MSGDSAALTAARATLRAHVAALAPGTLKEPSGQLAYPYVTPGGFCEHF